MLPLRKGPLNFWSMWLLLDPSFQPSLKDAISVGIATQSTYNRKFNHYRQLLAERRNAPLGTVEKLGAIPFVATTTGYIHSNSLRLLKDLAVKASIIHDIPYCHILHRFKKLIACALQRGIAIAILTRTGLTDPKTFSRVHRRTRKK